MSNHTPKQPTLRQLEELATLTIDTVNGVVNGKNGKPIGYEGAEGYYVFDIVIDGTPTRFKRHHTIWWKYHGSWPASMLDHINRIRRDDRIGNLRLSSSSLNNANRIEGRFLRGVQFDARNRYRPYEAYMTVDYKRKHLGYFATEKEAHNAYLIAKANVT